MDIRDWVQRRFGAEDTESLLNESVYSREELRKDKSKLEHRLNETEKEMNEYYQEYRKLLEKGARKSDIKRKQYAQKAKITKKKYKMKKKKYKSDSIKLGTIVSIEGMREIIDMQNDADITLDEALDDIDAQQLQGKVMDQMAEFGLEIEDMQQVQDALDVQILDDDLEQGASEELELIQEMAAGEVSKEQVSLDEEVTVNTDKVEMTADETRTEK